MREKFPGFPAIQIPPCPVPVLDPKCRERNGGGIMKIGRKEAHTRVTRYSMSRSKGHRIAGRGGAAQVVCFTGTLMSYGRLVYICVTVQIITCRGRGILWWHHCRPHSLFYQCCVHSSDNSGDERCDTII